MNDKPHTSSGSKSRDTRGVAPSQQDVRDELQSEGASTKQRPAATDSAGANGDSAGSADSGSRDTD